MKTSTIATLIGLVMVTAVGVILWILIIAAVIHVFGCSMSLEVESEMHHHESESLPLLEPTPTPAARVN